VPNDIRQNQLFFLLLNHRLTAAPTAVFMKKKNSREANVV
jgi:hypothetical protein